MKPRCAVALAFLACVSLPAPAASEEPPVTLLASGLEGGSGSTIGPGGALYVTEGLAGRVSRIDLKTGEITTFASGQNTTRRRVR